MMANARAAVLGAPSAGAAVGMAASDTCCFPEKPATVGKVFQALQGFGRFIGHFRNPYCSF
jgi:hypothetical protein